MIRRGGLLAALLLSALTMSLEFAHVLEWRPKASYSGSLYTRLQESLYVWYGNIGSVIYVLAVIADRDPGRNSGTRPRLAQPDRGGRSTRSGGPGGVPGGRATGQLQVPRARLRGGPSRVDGLARPLGSRPRHRVRRLHRGLHLLTLAALRPGRPHPAGPQGAVHPDRADP